MVDINNNKMSLNFLSQDEQSKGLFQLLKDLDLIPFDAKSSNFLLPRLNDIAKSHQAFEIDSN